ncbi:uncharacterized protein LOC134204030 [Armigeres subalbatus]|uniref:uncharacterized protein LOC134204030 n=1 Tax=Armigeres subalbatus TaxID=124917 RepID=UPI002ED0338B
MQPRHLLSGDSDGNTPEVPSDAKQLHEFEATYLHSRMRRVLIKSTCTWSTHQARWIAVRRSCNCPVHRTPPAFLDTAFVVELDELVVYLSSPDIVLLHIAKEDTKHVYQRRALNIAERRLQRTLSNFMPSTDTNCKRVRGAAPGGIMGGPDQVFTVRQISQKCLEYNVPTHHLFIDFKAANT